MHWCYSIIEAFEGFLICTVHRSTDFKFLRETLVWSCLLCLRFKENVQNMAGVLISLLTLAALTTVAGKSFTQGIILCFLGEAHV